MDKNELGILGENKAVEFLKKKGYEILERNWRFRKYEVDVIARFKDKLVFIEVKTRENDFIRPEDTVSTAQRKRIIKAANEYIVSNDLDSESQFDIVSVIHNQKYQKLEHFEMAFYVTGR